MTDTASAETSGVEDSYVRTVEVVSLRTFAQLMGFEYRRFVLPHTPFNIYERRALAAPEVAELVHGRQVDVLPHPAWKICAGDRFFVEEIGHSEKLAIKGLEYWPEFGGKFHIRKQAPVVSVPADDVPYFLLGGDPNYYHWVLNFVPRLMVLDRLRQDSGGFPHVKLVVPEQVSPNALSLIAELGYPPQDIVQLHDRAVWRFEELLVPSLFGAAQLSPTVFEWYRNKLGLPRRSPPRRKILITRGDAPTLKQRRRVVNEDEVRAALAPLGFESHALAGLSLRQQIELFDDAHTVVGPHGAGFANMTFSQPGARAVVLENSWNHTFMVDMINVGGGRARSLVCEDVVDEAFEAAHHHDPLLAQELRRNRDMRVDVDQLLRTLRELEG